MLEAKESSSCGTRYRRRHWTNSFNHRCWAALRPTLGVAATVLSCWVTYGAEGALPSPTPPIKIAVFGFELEDFSAAGQAGSAATEASYLARRQTKQNSNSAHRDAILSLTPFIQIPAAKGQGLHNCGGCEAPIALSLGAEQAFTGVVTKISMTEYTVRFRISDAQNGQVISTGSTDLRMGADYSWSRGVRWLMQNRMPASK